MFINGKPDRNSQQPTTAHRPGVAMILVMVAVTIAMVMSLSFHAAQSTTHGVSENIRRHDRARYIAESALALGFNRVKDLETWRSDHTSGVWYNNISLHGGTYQLSGIDADGVLNDDDTDPLTLSAKGTYQGVTHVLSAELTFPELQGGAPAYGVFCSGTIELKGFSEIDSFDSSLGAYGGSNKGPDASVVTLSTSSSQVRVSLLSMINGDVYVGMGGNPNTVIYGWGVISGSESALTQSYSMPAVFPWPANMPANSGSKTYTSTQNFSSNQQFDDLVFQNNAIVNITGNLTWRVNKKFVVQDSAQLKIMANSSLTVVVGESIEFKDSAKVNVNTANSTKLVIFGRGIGYEHKISNSAKVYAILDYPKSRGKLENFAELYGAILATDLLVEDLARVHTDNNPAVMEVNPRLVVVGGGGASVPEALARWTELP